MMLQKTSKTQPIKINCRKCGLLQPKHALKNKCCKCHTEFREL